MSIHTQQPKLSTFCPCDDVALVLTDAAYAFAAITWWAITRGAVARPRA